MDLWNNRPKWWPKPFFVKINTQLKQ
jgi:hypothetical protein